MSNLLPSLNALRAFDEVARQLSISRAAERLHVTHGAVSRQVRQLEEQLGVQLLRKAGRGIALTAQGEQLRAVTSLAFDQLEQGCEQLRRQAQNAPLVLSCSGSFLARWFIPRLDRLRQQCPGLDLHLTASEEAQWPLRTGIDAELRFAVPPWPAAAQVVELAPELIGPVLRPDLTVPGLQSAGLKVPPIDGSGTDLTEGAFSLAQLAALPLLHTRSREQAWPIWFAAQGQPMPERQATDRDQHFEHLNYMLEAALVGLGVAIAPAYLVEEDLRTGRLIAPWGFIETPARLGLWLPPGPLSSGVQQLVGWLQQALSGLPAPVIEG